MKSLAPFVLAIVVLTGTVLLVAACSEQDTAALDATVTPLPGTATSEPEVPTSTLAPTPTLGEQDIADEPDIREGRALLEEKQFERAIVAFERFRASHRDNQAVKIYLAEAYYQWGVELVRTSGGDLNEVSDALDRFSEGLSDAPPDSKIYQSLEWEQQSARGYLQGSLELEELRRLRRDGEEPPQEQKGRAISMLQHFEGSWKEHPNFPGLQRAYLEGILETVAVYEDLADAQESRKAKDPFWEEARKLCAQGQEIAAEGSEKAKQFGACMVRVGKKMELPTATPSTTGGGGTGTQGGASGRPPPTSPPPANVQIPDVHGADVGQAKGYLESLGFSVAVSPLSPGEATSLCNGWVSYSSPSKGTYAPRGSLVRLFYRDHNQPNPPGCQ
jgi:tetratricopeptide (TPR) repeat protein